MVRFNAAESSLTVYSGRLARTGGAAWRGVPVIAPHDTRPGGGGEIGVAEAGRRRRKCYTFHHHAADDVPAGPTRRRWASEIRAKTARMCHVKPIHRDPSGPFG